MARWATFLCTCVFVSSCGFETGSTDRSKAPWEPGPLGGKADAITVDKGSIGFGDTLAGIPIHKGELHRYAFFAVAGSKLRVTMTAVAGSGYPDTFLQLATPGGDLYSDDDGGVGFNSRLEILGLPDSGTYTLYATTYLQAGTGDYDLALECLGAGCASAPQSQSDDDHDGFSEAHGDCNDGDPDVSPEAPEIPGNLRDDDCDGKVDEGCNDPGTCDRPPRAPRNVTVTGNYDGYSARCRVTGEAEPNTMLTVYSNSRRATLASNYAVSATGAFSVTIYSNCAPGDVLQLSVSDGVNDGANVVGTVSGIDSYAPIAPDSVSVSAVQSGQVTVTATAEIFGELVVTNTYDGAQHVAPVDSSSGTASISVPAWHGDTLELRARDAAGNTGPATLAVVP